MSLSKWLVRSSSDNNTKTEVSHPLSNAPKSESSSKNSRQASESKPSTVSSMKNLPSSRMPLWALNLDLKDKPKGSSTSSQTPSPVPTESVSSNSSTSSELKSFESEERVVRAQQTQGDDDEDRPAVQPIAADIIDLSSSPAQKPSPYVDKNKLAAWPMFQSKAKDQDKQKAKATASRSAKVEIIVEESVKEVKSKDAKPINPFFLSGKEKKQAATAAEMAMNEASCSIESKFLEQIEESKRRQAAIFKTKERELSSDNPLPGTDFFGKVRMQMKDRKECSSSKGSTSAAAAGDLEASSSTDSSEVYEMRWLRQYGIPSVDSFPQAADQQLGLHSAVDDDEDKLELSGIINWNSSSANICAEVMVCALHHPALRETLEPGLQQPGAYSSTLRELWTAWQCELSLQQSWPSTDSSCIDLTQDEIAASAVQLATAPASVGSTVNAAALTTIQQFMEVWAGKRRRARNKRREQQSKSSKPSTRRFRVQFQEEEEDYEETDFCNPLIILGCSGSGKTSAVYTAAEQVGFHVIEVSIPSLRHGNDLLKRCSEAVQSHGLTAATACEELSSSSISSGNPAMNLILLDEMDLSLESESEKKMSAAVLELVRSSKVPIVITTERWLKWFESFALYDSTCMQRQSPTAADNEDLLLYLCDGDPRAGKQSQALMNKSRSSDHDCKGVAEEEDWYRWLAQKYCDVAAFDCQYEHIARQLEGFDLRQLPEVPYLTYRSPSIQRIDYQSRSSGAKAGDLLTIHGSGFKQQAEVDSTSSYPRIEVYVGGVLCEEVRVLSDHRMVVRLPPLSATDRARGGVLYHHVGVDVRLALSPAHRLQGSDHHPYLLRCYIPSAQQAEEEDTDADMANDASLSSRLKRPRSKVASKSYRSIDKDSDSDDDFVSDDEEEEEQKQKPKEKMPQPPSSKRRRKIVIADEDEEEDEAATDAMIMEQQQAEDPATEAPILAAEATSQAVAEEEEPSPCNAAAVVISLPINQQLASSTISRELLQGECMALELLARNAASFSDSDALSYACFDDDAYGSASMLRSSAHASAILELADRAMSSSLHADHECNSSMAQLAMRRAFLGLRSSKQQLDDLQASSSAATVEQTEARMEEPAATIAVTEAAVEVEEEEEGEEVEEEAEISFDSDEDADEGSPSNEPASHAISAQQPSSQHQHQHRAHRSSSTRSSYLRYVSQRSSIEFLIRNFSRYAKSSCSIGSAALAYSAAQHEHSAIPRALVLETLPYLAQILVAEQQQYRIYGNLLSCQRSTRRSSTRGGAGSRISVVYPHTTAATGLSELMLQQMMRLPFLDPDPPCCRSFGLK
jgi:hypothetical protein